jgi:tetratricopeptide (TPR) repeat protein
VRRVAPGIAVSAIGCVLVGCSACGSNVPPSADSKSPVASPQTGAAGPISRLPVVLPDLSRAAAPVEQQLRERYSSLMMKAGSSTTPIAELAHEYGEMGRLLMAAEYRDAAEPCFLNAQALAPDDARWPHYLAHLYRLRNEPARSAVMFERTIQLRPGDAGVLSWLGAVHLLEGRLEPAESLFAKALSVQPRMAAALFGLGRTALAKGDYARAVKLLEEALAQDPLASAVHYPLAMAYRGLGERDKAEVHLKQRGQIEPAPPDSVLSELNGSLQSALAYERLGTRALDKKEWVEAAAYFRRGVELAPDSASVRHRLGTALFMTGDARAAMEQFEEVVRRSPDFVKARYSLGVLMLTGGRESEGIEQLRAAVRFDPGYLEARLRLGEALRRRGRLQESLIQFEQTLEIDPRNAEGRFGFATTLIRLGRYQDARVQLIEGMQAYPRQPEFGRALARLLAAAPDDSVRDGAQAREMARRLLEQRQTIDLGETMAMALAEVGQYEQAAALQRDVMRAAAKAGRPDVVKQMAANLALYEAGRPCRVPLRMDDPVESFEPAP